MARMAYTHWVTVRFKFAGVSGSADTPEEAAKLLELLQAQQDEQDRHHALKRAERNMHTGHLTEESLLEAYGNPWDGGVFLRYIERLGSPQKRVLEMLLSSERVTDEELRVALKLKGNQALAGILSGLSKQAGALNISAREVFEVENFRSEGKRRSTYKASPNFRQRASEMVWPNVSHFNA